MTDFIEIWYILLKSIQISEIVLTYSLCSKLSENIINRKNIHFSVDLDGQNLFWLLLSLEIGSFQVRNLVQNWHFGSFLSKLVLGTKLTFGDFLSKSAVQQRKIPQNISFEPRLRLGMNLSPSSGGVRKSTGYLYRQEKSSSFDWCRFQRDPSTGTLPTRRYVIFLSKFPRKL